MKKQPIWLVCQGLNLIWGGFASFAFHASYLKMGHYIDIASMSPMIAYLALYACLDMFMEDLNRLPHLNGLGEIYSFLMAIIGFVVLIAFGFYQAATRIWMNWILIGPGIIIAIAGILKLFVSNVILRREQWITIWIGLVGLACFIIAMRF